MKSKIHEALKLKPKTMSNTKIIIAALLLSTAILSAQQAKEKTTTIRVQKTINVNGVEKTTDSTFTINGPVNILMLDTLYNENHYRLEPGKQKEMVIVTDEVQGDNYTTVDQKIIMDKQIENALKAADIDGIKFDVDKIMIMNNEGKETDAKRAMSSTKIIVIKRIKIEDLTSEDTKSMERTTGNIDQKLKVDQIIFYPNPNNGKFNLNFNLVDKGTTEISILNSEGKLVYSEELKDFSGVYTKEIDISNHPKGAYFVKIKQGAHSQLKKLIIY